MAGLVKRYHEGRCYICQYLEYDEEMGNLLEAWLVDTNKDAADICDYFNNRFGMIEGPEGEQVQVEEGPIRDNKWRWLTPKMLRTHSAKHMTNHQEIFKRARQNGMIGNISLERSVRDQLAVLEALKESGTIKVMNGEIQVDTLSQLLNVFDYEHKVLGGDKVEIKVGGAGGLNIPPDMLTSIIGVMRQFIDPRDQVAFRKKLDEEVFPIFKRYAEGYESETGKDFTKASLPPGVSMNSTDTTGEEIVDAIEVDSERNSDE